MNRWIQFTAVPVFLLVLLAGCGGCSPSDKINKGGELVGQGVGEFVEGVASGVDKSFSAEVEVSDALAANIGLGQIQRTSSDGTSNNQLDVYIIFSKALDQDVTIKVYDNDDLEMGRATIRVAGEANEASYFSFVFDTRTDIDFSHRVVME